MAVNRISTSDDKECERKGKPMIFVGMIVISERIEYKVT
jgi:hypothetical protein